MLIYPLGFFLSLAFFGFLRLVQPSGGPAQPGERKAPASPDSPPPPHHHPTLSHHEQEVYSALKYKYLVGYLLAVFADWLKGPYVYVLYESYGFGRGDIALLFIGGFGSSMVFGTLAGTFADVAGRKRTCMLFCVAYSLAALTKLVNSFSVLFLGRVLSGVSTSILFSSFESWFVSEFNKAELPSHLLEDVFRLSSLGNGVAAVVAGLVASFAAERWGFVAPFLMALVPLVTLLIFLISNWEENYGAHAVSIGTAIKEAAVDVVGDRKLFYLGAAQSLFEGAMYTWVLMWTPALQEQNSGSGEGRGVDDNIPYGLVFAAFMVCVMIGSEFFPIGIRLFKVTGLPYLVHALSTLCMLVVWGMFYDKVAVYSSFLLFEGVIGVFYPLYSVIRSAHLPERTRATIMNFIRIPLNLFVVLFLFKAELLTTQQIFGVCTLANLLSLLSYNKFRQLCRAESQPPPQQECKTLAGSFGLTTCSCGAVKCQCGIGTLQSIAVDAAGTV